MEVLVLCDILLTAVEKQDWSLAAKLGERTRTQIREKSIELRDQAEDLAEDARVRAEEAAEEARKRAEELQQRGRQVYEEQRARLTSAVEEGKKATLRKKEELMGISRQEMIWEKDGKEMVRIPAGEFLYGNKKEKRTQPEFWMDKTPVTNAEYAHFVAATNHEPPQHWNGKTPPKNIADHPVTNVSWNDAVAYAEWAGKRLPAEEVWEKAARGTDGRMYPWGNQKPIPQLCNFGQNEKGTTPVGKYSPQGDSPYGCVDMAGNVWEWTASDYDKERKVLRGGSWGPDAAYARAALRYNALPGDRGVLIGFRCVGSGLGENH